MDDVWADFYELWRFSKKYLETEKETNDPKDKKNEKLCQFRKDRIKLYNGEGKITLWDFSGLF